MLAADDSRSKRWFDGHTPQDHIRDGLQLLVRVVLLTLSAGCM